MWAALDYLVRAIYTTFGSLDAAAIHPVRATPMVIRAVLRRLVIVLPLTLASLAMVFVITRLLPGDPVFLILGEQSDAAQRAQVRHQLGFDQSLPVQFWHFIVNFARGDWGTSLVTGSPVMDDLKRTAPSTFELATLSMILAIAIGITLGCRAAVRPGGVVDVLSDLFSAIAISLPTFWVGIVAIYVFYVQLGMVPPPSGQMDPSIQQPVFRTGMLLVDSLLAGKLDAFGSAFAHAILPVATLTFVLSAPIVRQTRSEMQQALASPYVEFAELCGLPGSTVVRYALRNALLPIITTIGVLYSITLGGAVLVETVFGWAGLGQYAVQAVTSSDYFAIQDIVLVTTLFSVVVYLAVDALHALADPRIRH